MVKKRCTLCISVLYIFLILAGCHQDRTGRFLELSTEHGAAFVSVEPISQHPLYPTGCESVTAVMALRHSGFSISVDEFIDEWLPCSASFYELGNALYGPDPYTVFVGDPRSDHSYGCMSPVIYQALCSYVNDKRQVIDASGSELEQLCHTYIDNGIPVIVWATINMQTASAGNSWFLEDGRLFVWTAGEHCLLLIGYNDKEYIFNDPYYGKTVAYMKEDVTASYAALGKQALALQ